jgi:hypothetical protein
MQYPVFKPKYLGFADVPDLAWQVYQLCEQSRAAAFADAASDVSRLFIGVRSLKDRLETDTFSTDNTDEIMGVLNKCCRTLRSFPSVIGIYGNTSQRGRAHWNSSSSRNEFYGMETLKADLQGNIELISALNRDLTRYIWLPDGEQLTQTHVLLGTSFIDGVIRQAFHERLNSKAG